ncbi:hypothetical protein K1719_026010 [Acacia pycnantha]|nr:hypothetical protein K1719_026010 [Acacia pycnantha]
MFSSCLLPVTISRTGTQGKKEGFKVEVNRDIALVNKNFGVLKDEYHIPKSWRIDQNKGLVYNNLMVIPRKMILSVNDMLPNLRSM